MVMTIINGGIMAEEEIKLTVDGETRICEKGDGYVIPAEAKYYARFLSKSRVIGYFSFHYVLYCTWLKGT